MSCFFTADPLLAQPGGAAAAVSSFHDLYALSQEQALSGAKVEIGATVICYDLGWNQLYLNDGAETSWFSAGQFPTNIDTGSKVLLTGSTTYSQGNPALTNLHLQILGQTMLPEPKRLKLSELGTEFGEWIESRGRVRVADASQGRLSLILSDQGQTCQAYVMGTTEAANAKPYIGCLVRVRGINASKVSGNHLESAVIFASGLSQVTILEKAKTTPSAIPVVSVDSLMSRELGSWTNEPVHINGTIVSYKPGDFVVVRDVTGTIRARVTQLTQAQREDRAEVWGYLTALSGETVLRDAFFELWKRATVSIPVGAPVSATNELTKLDEISKLSREDAAKGIPVRIRGVVTFADPEWRNCFIQNKQDAIYVDLNQNDIAPGQWVEVTGRTSPGGYAPEIVNSSFHILGMTNLPAAAEVDLNDFVNGFWDSRRVRLEGVVRSITKQWNHATLLLMTPKGRFKAILPIPNQDAELPGLIDAFVAVQGACTSDINARGQLTGVTLHVSGMDQIKVLEAVPENPFSTRTTPVSAVATFDPGRMAGRRVKISGVVTQVNPAIGFYLQDETGGIRVSCNRTEQLHVGDAVNVLGFPAVGDYSPYLEEAVYEHAGTKPLPPAEQTTAAAILTSGTNDGTRVQIAAYLVNGVPKSARPKLVAQSGAIIFPAELGEQAVDRQILDLQPGSLVRLTGVCVIQGGTSHEADSFRLLLSQPGDVQLISAPAWWTMKYTVMLAGGLALGALFAWAWGGTVRRQVRLQTEVIRRNEEQLMTVSRLAGMAEVATAVLHNVGNVLNSVNVSASLLSDNVRKSKVTDVSRVADLLKQHGDNLEQYLTKDAKGAQVSKYLAVLGEHLTEEKEATVRELELLTTNIQHIKEIVAMQQNYAKIGGVTEIVSVSRLIDDALRMHEGALDRHAVKLIRNYDDAGACEVEVQKHKVLQILVNLISNAKYACSDSGRPDKQLAIRVSTRPESVTMAFEDNGVGIPQENMPRIFNHGFTTRKNGHGFGLHSAALTAKEMGGSLQVQSAGAGLGATFILELPRSGRRN